MFVSSLYSNELGKPYSQQKKGTPAPNAETHQPIQILQLSCSSKEVATSMTPITVILGYVTWLILFHQKPRSDSGQTRVFGENVVLKGLSRMSQLCLCRTFFPSKCRDKKKSEQVIMFYHWSCLSILCIGLHLSAQTLTSQLLLANSSKMVKKTLYLFRQCECTFIQLMYILSISCIGKKKKFPFFFRFMQIKR